MAYLHTAKSSSSEHTIEDQSYNERKEQDKGDIEDWDLKGDLITRYESIEDENSPMGNGYVQDRPRHEEVCARSLRIGRNSVETKREKEWDLQSH